MAGRDCETQFTYEFQTTSGRKSSVVIGIGIPFTRNLKEFCNLQMKVHCIPIYMEDDLLGKISEFIERNTKALQDFEASQQLEEYVSLETGQNTRIEDWATAYQNEWQVYSGFTEYTDGEPFSEISHQLVHSPALETLLQLENSYAMAVHQLIEGHKQQLFFMQTRQDDELKTAMDGLGVSHSDADINGIMRVHIREKEDCEVRFSEELKHLKASQKREYQEWITKAYNDLSKGVDVLPANTKSGLLSPSEVNESNPPPRMEESFTVHLGAQMKVMHNLRLICCNVFDFCHHESSPERPFVLSPHRIQTTLSLYSNSLSALVLLVDGRITSHTGNKEKFSNICKRATDFHFPSLESQLDNIKEQAKVVKEKREMFGGLGRRLESPTSPANDSDNFSKGSMSNSSQSYDAVTGFLVGSPSDLEMSSSDVQTPISSSGLSWASPVNQLNESEVVNGGNDSSISLKPGDFYITNHSILSEVHVLFHLVVNEVPTNPVISSHHHIMVGLRNCLRIATRHSIGLLTIPLLLVDKMTPDMTITWCMKRAEVVFKCVKGYMLESVSGVDIGSTVIQFLVPPGITEDLFTEFCELLQKVFKMTTARNLNPSSNKHMHKSASVK